MAQSNGGARGQRKKPVALYIFLFLFTLFVANVLLGKGRVEFGWNIPFLLNDVMEFLLLLLGALFFVRAALTAEQAANGKAGRDRPDQQDLIH